MYQYTVSELPINMWTDKFKEMCDQYRESNLIKTCDNYSEVTTVNFKISSEHELTIENLKLRSYIHTSNMVMFDHEGKIHKYETLKWHHAKILQRKN